MLKILKIKIQRYRSIMEMNLDVESDYNIMTLCGQNNVGKTNTLRAIDLFFNPDKYDSNLDIPTLKKATWGGSVHPRIDIVFFDDSKKEYYEITRDFKPTDLSDVSLDGIHYKGSQKRKIGKKKLSEKELKDFMKNIFFVFVESINTVVPSLIDGITNDVLNVQYDKTKFTKNKKDLKSAYETYVDGLQGILNTFSDDISGTFKYFRDSWNVKFHVPKNSESFRDLISDDVVFQLDDKGSTGIIDKGSGLQRLAYILMQFEVAKRMPSSNTIIVCIDEPDIYLHEGLQKKLYLFLIDQAEKMQIFYTTHSKTFIDTYRLKNTFLLSAEYSNQYVTRKQKDINIIETILEDINSDDGNKKICEHLGIELKKNEVLSRNSILVEGECDKKYLEELMKYFSINAIDVMVANGADNIKSKLEFYNSFYDNSSLDYKPKIKVILDNDVKGRDVSNNLNCKKFRNLEVEKVLLPNCYNNANMKLTNNSTNNEIEDFIYPDIFCFLANSILSNKNMKNIDSHSICKKISSKAFRSGGILSVCEYEKNSLNPDNGNEISFIGLSLKNGIAKMMNIEGNKQLIEIMQECDLKYPFVHEFLCELCKF
ncbi:MAG: AAA family ATPase [Bacilli bacterium]